MKIYVFNEKEMWTTAGAFAIVADSKEEAAKIYEGATLEWGKSITDYVVSEHEIVPGFTLQAEGYDEVRMVVVVPEESKA